MLQEVELINCTQLQNKTQLFYPLKKENVDRDLVKSLSIES